MVRCRLGHWGGSDLRQIPLFVVQQIGPPVSRLTRVASPPRGDPGPGQTTDQLRTTPAELSTPQRSTMDTSGTSFTLDNRQAPIWGSRGREFKSRQPDIMMADCDA